MRWNPIKISSTEAGDEKEILRNNFEYPFVESIYLSEDLAGTWLNVSHAPNSLTLFLLLFTKGT